MCFISRCKDNILRVPFLRDDKKNKWSAMEIIIRYICKKIQI